MSSRYKRSGHHRTQSVNLPVLKHEQDAIERLSFLTNNQSRHLTNPEVRKSLENLQHTSSVFVKSSKHLCNDAIKDQRKHKRNKSYVLGNCDWKQLPGLPESALNSSQSASFFSHSIKELKEEHISSGRVVDYCQVDKPQSTDYPPSDVEQHLPSLSHFKHSLLVTNTESSFHSPLSGSPSPLSGSPSSSRGSVSPLLIRQLSSSSKNGCLSYLSTPESPHRKGECNPEDSFKHSMFVVDCGPVHVDPRASLSELKSENTLTRP